MRFARRVFGLVVTGAMLVQRYVTPAHAEGRLAVEELLEQRRLANMSETAPNRDLIASGVFTLGVPYLISVFGALASERSGDAYLYVPVAGPWIDWIERGGCEANASCGNETAYRVALIADGLLQTAGALEIIGGFAFPVSHSVMTVRAPSIRGSMATGAGRIGVSVTGTF